MRKLVSALLIFGVAGCALGPEYSRPAQVERALPSEWRSGGNAPASTTLAEWWSLFKDPTLTELVTTAPTTSPTIAEAYARLMQARGLAQGSDALGRPSLSLQGQPFTRQGTGSHIQKGQSIGASVTWELDVFGGAQREKEASAARAEGAAYQTYAAHVALASDVATAYFARRGCERQLVLNGEDLAARQSILRLTQLKFNAGSVAVSDVARARASVAEAEGQRAALNGSCNRTFNQLVALTGLSPDELAKKLAGPSAAALPAQKVSAVPASLLSSRADVRNAEALLKAASAGIGAAEADRFPRFTLSGVLTSGSSGVLGAPGVALTTWSFATGLTAPLFDNGKRAAATQVARAKYQEVLAAYQGQVRTAVREVEDALSKVGAAEEQRPSVLEAEQQYGAHFNAVEQRYRAGVASLLEVEDARRAYLAAKTTAVASATDQLQAHVSLYRALGGGWADKDTNGDSQ